MKIETCLLEHRPIAQRGNQRMLSEFGDAVLVDIWHEAAGQQHAELRMADARERFGAGEAFALEIDLRLIPDFEPTIAQRLRDRDVRGACPAIVESTEARRASSARSAIGADQLRTSSDSESFMRFATVRNGSPYTPAPLNQW